MKMEKIYVCSYSKGEYEGHEDIHVFCTVDESKAIEWTNRMNKIIPVLREHNLSIWKKWELSGYSGFIKSGVNIWFEFNSAWYMELELR